MKLSGHNGCMYRITDLGQTLKTGSGPNSGKLLLGKRILIVVSGYESNLM